MTPKISIVMAYNNRRNSLINTLQSIKKSKYFGELEVVIVDDNSDDQNQIGDIGQMGFPFPIKLVTVLKEQKWWKNPCVPFNLAIKQAEGRITILQNPENYHVTDIVKRTLDSLTDRDYFVYKVFALTEEQSKDIENTIKTVPFESISTFGRENGWYIHPRYRPGYYHFVSAIDTNVLKNDLGGFDERFAQGWGFDDDEFVIRIHRRGLRTQIINDHLALHQWHPPSVPFQPTNEALRDCVVRENKIKANE